VRHHSGGIVAVAEEELPALVERLLAVDAVTQSTSALLHQLLWVLIAKGLIEKGELLAAIDTCIMASRRGDDVAGEAAANHLSHIRATIAGGDLGDRAH
jgi:membrane protein required for beta-lactamase induction